MPSGQTSTTRLSAAFDRGIWWLLPVGATAASPLPKRPAFLQDALSAMTIRVRRKLFPKETRHD